MDEQCEGCGGCLGVGAPHVCDPNEVALMGEMRKYSRVCQAEEYRKASEFLEEKGSLLPHLPEGWIQAISALRQESARLRK